MIPAALEQQITAANAYRVRAWFVVEGANGPPPWRPTLSSPERYVVVVSDILANAGDWKNVRRAADAAG